MENKIITPATESVRSNHELEMGDYVAFTSADSDKMNGVLCLLIFPFLQRGLVLSK